MKTYSWVVKIQYPTKQSFWWGNVYTDTDSLEQAIQETKASLPDYFPDGWEVVDVKMGQVVISFKD